jgi:hypothetical protein
MALLAVLVIMREVPAFTISKPDLRIRATHLVALIATIAFLLLTAIIYFNVSVRKPHGAWDSWAIYNRTARMIYRSQSAWTDAFSPELYWYFHADYPPLLALNIASGWEAVGEETVRVPMAVSGAFLFGSLGLTFAGMHELKSMGQAALAVVVLVGTSAYAEMGAKQVADVPLAFFLLATGALLLAYAARGDRGLLVLAGLASGLAAWTKNEGIPFTVASLIAVPIAFRGRFRETAPWFALGLALPAAALIYFKLAIAPPGDLFVYPLAQLGGVIEPDRHLEILRQFSIDLGTLNAVLPLAVYALFMGVEGPGKSSSAFWAGLLMLAAQLVAYYGIFLISPHDLTWHLASLYRLLLQVQPLLLFLYFYLVRTPETALQEVSHAAGH